MRRATKTRSFSFPDAIWYRFWSPRRAIRLSRALFLASRHALWDSPGAPGASRGRHETLPRHLLNALGRHGVPQKAPRIDFRYSAWRWPHLLTNSLISCEPADTVESPCGPAHTKQGCLSIRVACAYPNAHGRDSSTRAPFGPSHRSSPHAIRACTPFESARHARDVQNVWFCMARHAKKKRSAYLSWSALFALPALPALPASPVLPYMVILLALLVLPAPPALPASPALPSLLALPAVLFLPFLLALPDPCPFCFSFACFACHALSFLPSMPAVLHVPFMSVLLALPVLPALPALHILPAQPACLP